MTNDNTSNLIEIAKANGAAVNKGELTTWTIRKGAFYFEDEAQLKATIDAVNKANKDPHEKTVPLSFLTPEQQKELYPHAHTLNVKVSHEATVNAQTNNEDEVVLCGISRNVNKGNELVAVSVFDKTDKEFKTFRFPQPNNPNSIETNSAPVEPVAYLDENKQIVIVGFDAWNNCVWVDVGRAIPNAWIPVSLAPSQSVNEALEKAAKICDDICQGYLDKYITGREPYDEGAVDCADECSREIRALINAEKDR